MSRQAITSLSSTASRIGAPSRLPATIRAFSSSSSLASGSATPLQNTINVDPRVLDGQTFLPKANVDRLCEWQTGLWERLAKEVRNNPGLLPVKQKWESSGLDIAHLLSETARDPSLGLAFNYASLLVNNSYFLEGINAGDKQSFPDSYGGEPKANELKEKLEAYADGIVGGGWLWLVRVGQEHNKLEIIPTFGAGTLLITQRAQVGRSDLNLFLAPSSPSSSSPSPSSSSSSPSEPEPSASASARADTPSSPPLNQATSTASSRSQQQQQRANARSANSSNALDSASKITPLAVLNTFETAWLGDKYGVWGKSKYAGEWFESLDWQRIFDRVRR